jgi:hypothetical protein
MYTKIYYTTSSVIGHSVIERTLHFRTILTVKAIRLEVNVNKQFYRTFGYSETF